METVSAVVYGIATLVAIVLVTVFACFPDTKIPVVSEFFAKVNQLEKNNIRTLSTKVSVSDCVHRGLFLLYSLLSLLLGAVLGCTVKLVYRCVYQILIFFRFCTSLLQSLPDEDWLVDQPGNKKGSKSE